MNAAQARRGDVLVRPGQRLVVESVWQMHDATTGAQGLALGLYDPATDTRAQVPMDPAAPVTLDPLGGPR